MSEGNPARIHLLVGGRVQGVGYRFFVAHHARELGICGWARNLSTGEVEMVGEGDRARLEAWLAYARKGPPHAIVTKVTETWEKFRCEFEDFRVR